MFYYYGRKKKIAHLYPQPKFDSIVEPFAGSAAYSLHGNNWEKDVFLYDIDLRIVRLWQFLQQASVNDIKKLPCEPEMTINDHKQLSRAEKDLIGLHLSPGSSMPANISTKYDRWAVGKQYILENVHKIKHWTIQQASYRMIVPEAEATWFIDPPYNEGGKHYRFGKIDYQHLADWIKNLKGQVIVCERDDADWLPFKSLTKFAGIANRTVKEGVYLKESQHA